MADLKNVAICEKLVREYYHNTFKNKSNEEVFIVCDTESCIQVGEEMMEQLQEENIFHNDAYLFKCIQTEDSLHVILVNHYLG